MWRSPVFGLQGPRIDLIPHQLYIAAEVARARAPRVLLADEVGLGKTIEAGLILHRLMLTERVQRVLVMLPDALVHQWLVEMLRRFNLPFAVFDQDRFDEADHANPFQTEQRVLCSLSFPDLIAGGRACRARWRVGPADRRRGASPGLERTGDRPVLPAGRGTGRTDRERAAADRDAGTAWVGPGTSVACACSIRSVSTTTRPSSPRRRPTRRLRSSPPACSTASHWMIDNSRCSSDLLGDEAGWQPQQIIARLIDRHGTGRVLFRNTRQAIKGFPGASSIRPG